MKKNRVTIQITGAPSSVKDMPKSFAKLLSGILQIARKIGDIETINMTQYGRLNDHGVRFKELTERQAKSVDEIDLSDLLGNDEPETPVEEIGEEIEVKVHSAEEAFDKAKTWFKKKFGYDGELGTEKRHPEYIWLYMKQFPGHRATFKANIR